MHINNIDAYFTSSAESICVSFKLAASRLCFLSARLDTDDDEVQERNEQLQTILTSLVFDRCSTEAEYKHLGW
jgi:hypothetical protein